MTAHPLVRYLALALRLLCGLMLSSASFAQSAPRVELAPVNREPIQTVIRLSSGRRSAVMGTVVNNPILMELRLPR
nr:hypothetical protein [Halomonas hydrothermalis]